jgi:hypothetical protein
MHEQTIEPNPLYALALNVPFSIGKPVKPEILTVRCLTAEHGRGQNKHFIAQSTSGVRKRH